MKKSRLTLFFLVFSITAYAQYGVETDPKTGKKGLIDPIEGYIKIPFLYDDVQPWAGDTFVTVTKAGKKGLLTESNRVIVPVDFDELDLSVQVGRTLGYAGVKRNGRWGLYQLEGGMALEPRFEFARAIHPDLLAGRLAGEAQLQFFDGSGHPVFPAEGESAQSGFDAETVEIIRVDKTRYFLNKNGEDPFAGRFPNGRWTDGQTVICATVSAYGMVDSVGLLTWAGDTLLPCVYWRIEPVGQDRFVVQTRSRKSGLADATGQFIIPLSPGELSKMGDAPDACYLLKGKGNFANSVYDAEGQLLLSNILVGNPDRSIHLVGRMPDEHQDRYFTAFPDFQQTNGLFHLDGRPILPMQYKHIKYASNRHPLIVHDGEAYIIMGWDGKPAYPERFRMLDFTLDPNLFYGQPKDGALSGFVVVNDPEKSQFIYEKINLLYRSGLYSVKEGEWYYLHGTDGRRLNPKGFYFIRSPDRQHYTAWREKSIPGKLVAIGELTKGLEATEVGIDETGKAYDFGTLKPLRVEEEAPVLEETEAPTGG
jgi:hypothetical protein